MISPFGLELTEGDQCFNSLEISGLFGHSSLITVLQAMGIPTPCNPIVCFCLNRLYLANYLVLSQR